MASRASNKPTVRDRVAEHICPNCGKSVERKSAKGPRPIYCTDVQPGHKAKCQIEMNRRLMKEGMALAPFIKAWRIDRGSGEIAQQSLQQMCEITDHFNAEDARAGRPRADYHAATILNQGTKYFDRRRKV